MKDIVIDATSDWHLGGQDAHNPTAEEIHASLQKALTDNVDGYLIAGDFTDRGNVLYAQYAASIIKPYVEQGLLVIGVVGNHDFHDGSRDSVTKILADSGVVMLEGQSYTIANKSGDREITVLGISGETGPQHDSWWRNGYDEEAKEVVIAASKPHREALQVGLAQGDGDVVLLTHRSIIPDTIGTMAREKRFVSAQMEGFAAIVNEHAARRRIMVIHGHDHREAPWEGFPEGITEGGVAVYNVAAPLRKRMGENLTRRFVL